MITNEKLTILNQVVKIITGFYVVILCLSMLLGFHFLFINMFAYAFGKTIITNTASFCFYSSTISFLTLSLEKLLYSEGAINLYLSKFYERSEKWYFGVCKFLVFVSYFGILCSFFFDGLNSQISDLAIICGIVYSLSLSPTTTNVFSIINRKKQE